MEWIFVSVVAVVLLFILLGITPKNSGAAKWKLQKRQFLSVLGLVIAVGGCIVSIPTGHTGILTTFGKVEDYTLEAGVHYKLPYQQVIKMDNRNQKATVDLSCFSSDIQEVAVTYTMNYQIEKANAQTIYSTIGVNYYQTVILPRIQEAVKTMTAKYNAEALIANRAELSAEIAEMLTTKLSTYNIEVIDASIENLDFTDAFTDAVEAKQVAEQNKLKATIEQEQKTIEQQAEADRAIIKANADLEVKKVQADAAEYAGQKDAAINSAIAASITPELVKYYYVKQWNGILPETMLGSENGVILDMN